MLYALVSVAAYLPAVVLLLLTARDLKAVAVAHDAMIAELQEFAERLEPRVDALDIEVMDRSL